MHLVLVFTEESEFKSFFYFCHFQNFVLRTNLTLRSQSEGSQDASEAPSPHVLFWGKKSKNNDLSLQALAYDLGPPTKTTSWIFKECA